MNFLMNNTVRNITSRYLLRPTTITTNIESLSTFVLCQKQRTYDDIGGSGESNAQKKSRKPSTKITLIQNQKDVSVTSLEDARNLAKRRSMHLVQIQKMDTKTQRPVYKLLTAADRLQEELSDLKAPGTEKDDDKTAQKKSEKTLNIGSRISDHDLSSRLKNIAKWLDKRHEVRILIQSNSDSDMASSEKIFKTIEESVRTPQTIGKIVQKRAKGSVIKFNILPVNATTTTTNQ